MKTTIELPDDLLRAVKVQAARENRKMKDLLTEIIERGMTERVGATVKRRAPRPLVLPGERLTIAAIEQSIATDRD